MNNILLINISFSAFFLLYLFLLKKLTFFKINRLYLMWCLLFSLLVPFMRIEEIPQEEQIFTGILLPDPIIEANIRGFQYSVYEILFATYLSGLIICSLVFISSLLKIWRLKRSSSKQFLSVSPYFLSEGNHAFSFFRFIYIGKELEPHTREMILRHELIHLKQLHSLDVITYACARIFFWFNPLVHWAAHEVQLNHEYTADEAVSQNYGKTYQYCLLNETLNTRIFPLSNSFFSQSLIKNRIIMMNKKRSTGRLSVLYALVVPLIAGSLWLSSCTGQEQEVPKENPQEKTSYGAEELDKIPQFPGGTEAMMDYFRTGLTYPTGLKDAGISGKCVIEFTVNEDGSISNVKTVKSDHSELEEPAIEFVKSMPDWIPGEKDGKKVKTKMYLPVQFSLS